MVNKGLNNDDYPPNRRVREDLFGRHSVFQITLGLAQ